VRSALYNYGGGGVGDKKRYIALFGVGGWAKKP
jgi:hypothetical protein